MQKIYIHFENKLLEKAFSYTNGVKNIITKKAFSE